MEMFYGLIWALLFLGIAALPFLFFLCILRFLGTVIGRGMAAGLQQARAPRRLVRDVADDDRSQGGQLFWTLVWLAAGGLVVLALVAG